MAEKLFYQDPVPLSPEQYRNLRLAPLAAEFGFARQTGSAIVAGIEFFEAAKEYPIVFAKNESGGLAAVALFGLPAGNAFVDAEGHWKARYIPAFIRRYPFVLAENGPGQPLTVCVDAACPWLNTAEGELLVDGEGKPTPRLHQVMAFLEDFQFQCGRTDAFIAKLQACDLLMETVAQAVAPDGRQSALQGIYVVNEQKLLELDDAKVLELHRLGYLGWIWAHLGSLSNLNRLLG